MVFLMITDEDYSKIIEEFSKVRFDNDGKFKTSYGSFKLRIETALNLKKRLTEEEIDEISRELQYNYNKIQITEDKYGKHVIISKY